jgi:hypothetical protein
MISLCKYQQALLIDVVIYFGLAFVHVAKVTISCMFL